LWLLGYSFGRDTPFSTLLILTGFAGLPWLLLAPAQALGGWLGALLGVIAIIWFLVWEIWATAIALDLPWWRVVWLVPLALIGGGLSISWISSGIVAIASLS
jgi:hypothetical protein